MVTTLERLAAMRVTLTCKNGDRYILDGCGNVLQRENGIEFDADGSWKILGFLRRFNSNYMVSLADALKGADIGHGFVVDLDHGTRRVWMMPKGSRAAWVK